MPHCGEFPVCVPVLVRGLEARSFGSSGLGGSGNTTRRLRVCEDSWMRLIGRALQFARVGAGVLMAGEQGHRDS